MLIVDRMVRMSIADRVIRINIVRIKDEESEL